MDELVAFLRERLDDEERAAQRADEGPWRLRTLGRHDLAAVHTDAASGAVQLDGSRASANAVHIVLHDPARVLRGIVAKRELISRCEALRADVLIIAGAEVILSEYRRVILPGLAATYSDHPGYRPEWAIA